MEKRMQTNNVVMEIRKLKKWFEVRRSPFAVLSRQKRQYIKAVDSLNFNIFRGEILGLVGESGCGKTTTGRLLANLIKPTEGEIIFEGKNIDTIKNKDERKKIRRKIQMIFQDPYEYLSPWSYVRESLAEPLRMNKLVNDKKEELRKIEEMMELVGLTPIEGIIVKYPHELSGGQRQRVVIARSLMLQPELLIADEPVSMVDVSLRLGILNLLLDLNEKFNLSILFITHDIASARYMCHRITVMYLGKIVEIGITDEVIRASKQPYTKALMSAVPIADPKAEISEIPIKGRIQTQIDLPSGCRFHPRCPYAQKICGEKEPELIEVGKDHLVACHFYENL